MAKFRTGMGLAPMLIAMFANSPICDGQFNGYRSFREHIWTDTDRSRSGLLKFAFLPTFRFAHYVEYALDVPMYFIIRNHDYIDMTSVTFRQFLEFGYNGERATIEDWDDHLTTLFPETRIKRYIEIRSVDSQPPELMPALSALIKGVFYDADCLQAAWDLVKGWSWDERMQIYLDSHRNALAARVPPSFASRPCQGTFEIAWEGLRRQKSLNKQRRRRNDLFKSAEDASVSGQVSGRRAGGKMGRGAASGHQEADRLQRLQAAVNFVNDASVISLRSGDSPVRFRSRR